MNEECPEDKSGSTATIAIILNGTLFVAHVGDSRAMVNENGKPIQLSKDADVASYCSEIVERGGTLSPAKNRAGETDRVMGKEGTPGEGYTLPVASSIGDSKNFPGVTAEPEVIKYLLPSFIEEGKHYRLILVTDGMTDGATGVYQKDGKKVCVANTQQIVEKVQLCANTDSTDPRDAPGTKQPIQGIALNLVQAAYQAGSTDNIMVVLVDLTPYINPPQQA